MNPTKRKGVLIFNLYVYSIINPFISFLAFSNLKRDVTVVVSSENFFRTGIMCDIVQVRRSLPPLYYFCTTGQLQGRAIRY